MFVVVGSHKKTLFPVYLQICTNATCIHELMRSAEIDLINRGTIYMYVHVPGKAGQRVVALETGCNNTECYVSCTLKHAE